ncbi:MAG TPA: MinD/ParA family protein [Streptosporangiaceae bacterium]
MATNDRDQVNGAGAPDGAGSDLGDAEDYEPYLPPGPNPFSSVHPQGAPPFERVPWSGSSVSEGSHDDDDEGPEAPEPATDPGLLPPAAVPPAATPPAANGQAARPAMSPYPPLPDDELGGPPQGEPRPGGGPRPGGFGASPYPTYTPYGPDDEIADDALTDYGLPSPQSYGYAPPPPMAEPLPDLGVPEPRFSPPPGGQSGPPAPPAPSAPAAPRGRPEDEASLIPGLDRPPHDGPERDDRDQDQPHNTFIEGGRPESRPPSPPPVSAAPEAAARPAAPPELAPPGMTPPGMAPPSGPASSGMAPPRDPAAAPPLGRPVPPPPARPQPAYAPGGSGNGLGGRPQGSLGGGPVRPTMPPPPPHDDFGPEPDADGAGETADSLTAEALLQGKRTAPGSGWRRTVYKATGGLVRVGESTAMQRRRELVWRARTPVAGGHHRVAVMSLKGGVGKTTTTVGLGATLATLRGDRVIAVDANPDRGTLSDKVRLETSATVRDLLNERRQVHRYADVRAFTSQASSRLEVLASDRDPGVSVAFSETDYCDVARVLEHYYSICITDCGTGLLHSAMTGVLTLADQIVLVSSPSVDGARSASATLDWLDAHGYGDLVRNAVVVLSTVRPRSKSSVDLERLEQHFAARCRDVVRIPYDPHLEEGAEVELEQLSPATTEAYLRLSATVGDGFAWPRRALNHSGATRG